MKDLKLNNSFDFFNYHQEIIMNEKANTEKVDNLRADFMPDLDLDDRPEIIKAREFEIRLNAIGRLGIPIFLFLLAAWLIVGYPSDQVDNFTNTDGDKVVVISPSGTGSAATMVFTGAFAFLNAGDFSSSLVRKLTKKKEDEHKPETPSK